jgi:hypothetical protein
VYEDAVDTFSVGAPRGDTQGSFYFTRSEWNEQFPRVCEVAERLTSSTLKKGELATFLEGAGMERWVTHIALLCSDASRRLGWNEWLVRCLEECGDPVLRDLGRRWVESKRTG